MSTFLIFLLVLSILVLVHELGHFLAARMLGIKVEEFAFGLPFTKPIFKIRKGETQYAIYPLLFGGFVRLYGEEAGVTEKDQKDAGRDFWSRGKKQRMAVIGAGVVMNVLLALAAFVVLFAVVGVPVERKNKITVFQVAEGSPAQQAGVMPEDRIVKVEGRQMASADEFGELIKSYGDTGVIVTVERGRGTPLFEGIVEKVDSEIDLYMKPRSNPPDGQGALGVTIDDLPYLKTRQLAEMEPVGFFTLSVKQGIVSTVEWAGKVLDGLRLIGKSLVAGKSPEGVSGPVGIYQLTGVVASAGWLPLLELIAILSVNLAVFNVLPIPALDGGRMFFIWLELVLRRRISAETEQKVNSWGMAFLIGTMVLVSFQDVVRLGWIENLLGKK